MIVSRGVAALAVGMLIAASQQAGAEGSGPTAPFADLSGRVNDSAATIMVGDPSGTSMAIIEDMRSMVETDDGSMRVIPLVGTGGPRNLVDLLYMRNVDMAIIQSDALGAFVAGGGKADRLAQQLHYVARLHNMEVHILAADDVRTVADLADKPVAVGYPGSGSDLTASILFGSLGVTPRIVHLSPAGALAALKAGTVKAVLQIDGKPIPALTRAEVGDAKVHFVPIPWEGELEKTYLPTKLTHEDYPGLIPEGGEVPSVAAMAVLTSYGWRPGSPRYRRVAQFVEALFTGLPELQGETHHPKWKGMNFASEIPGWTRFKPAGEWLSANPAVVVATPTPDGPSVTAVPPPDAPSAGAAD